MKHFGNAVRTAFAATTLVFSALGAQAADYPGKPVNYVIPFAPGGESDVTARHQQPYFKELFGQDLVIEYKTGGGGAVAWSQLNGYAGDGHTWMGINLPHIVIQPLQKDVGYVTEDIVPVYFFHYTPDAIVVHKDSPFSTLKDLVDHAKKNPASLTLSGTGKGTVNHIAQVRFDRLADIKTTYVPFNGTAAASTALIGKHVEAQWGFTSVGAQYPDQVRLLAVALEERHPGFPDVPTFKELGYDLVSGAYRGIAVPKSTPESVRRQVSDAIDRINRNPEFRKRLESDGMALLDIGYDKAAEFLAEQARIYDQVAREAGVVN